MIQFDRKRHGGRLGRLASLVILASPLAACSSLFLDDPGSDPTQQRLAEVETRIQRVERLIDNDSLLQLAEQITQLQRNNQELTGHIEQLLFDLQQLQERQRLQYLDLEARVGNLEGGGAAPGQGQGPVAPASMPVPGGNDHANYEAALDLLLAGNYTQAQQVFTTFVEVFPNSVWLADSYYWLGEIAYVQRDFQAALTNFQTVIDRYSGSDKVRGAWLKVGYSNYELQRWADARTALQRVVSQYSGTTEATLAQARLDLMADQGR